MTEETQATPLASREAEVAQYQANIALYNAMVADLPSEWPAHLAKYKGTDVRNQHAVITELSNSADIELLSDLWTSDQCINSIKTETLEMRKAMAILKALEAQA
jgi:hypothetical protein